MDDVSVPRIVRAVREAATVAPTRAAVVTDSSIVTVGTLENASHGILTTIRRLDVPERTVIGLTASNGVTYVAALLAVLSSGNIVVPCDPLWGPEERRHVLADSGMGLLLCSADVAVAVDDTQLHYAERLPTIAKEEPLEIFVADTDTGARVRSVTPSETVAVFYTSGSTGQPKGVLLSDEAVTGPVSSVDTSETWLVPIGFHTIAGHSVVALALCTGGCVVTSRSFDPRLVLSLLTRERATQLAVSPAMLKLLTRAQHKRRVDSTSLRLISVGGASVSEACGREAAAAFNCPVVVTYGTTELGGGVAVTAVYDPSGDIEPGFFLPGIRAEVHGPDGKNVAPSEIGELVCDSPRRHLGYWANRHTKLASSAYWQHTRDLATIRPDGTLAIVGRSDALINRAGRKISPEEVEQVVDTYPGVRACAVVGVPDESLGQTICAVIEADDVSLDARELRRFIRQHLASYKCPDSIHIVDRLPTTSSGKIKRWAVPELLDQVGAPYDRGD